MSFRDCERKSSRKKKTMRTWMVNAELYMTRWPATRFLHTIHFGCSKSAYATQQGNLSFLEIIFPGVGVKCHLSKCRFDARCHTCIRSIQWLLVEASRDLNNSNAALLQLWRKREREQGGNKTKRERKNVQPWRTVDNSVNLIRYLYIYV